MKFVVAILLLLVAAPASAQQGQGLSKALVVSSCGGGTLSAGSQTNLTMNPQGQLCLVGIAPGGFCAQASAYLLRTTGGNEGGNAANIAALICGLVTDGIITGSLSGARSCGVYLDALYILAQQNVADAKLNLCGTSYTLPTNTATFTAYQGYSAFPNPAINTGFIASSATSPNFIQNSGSISAWLYNAPDGNAQIGTSSSVGNSYLFGKLSGTTYCAVNNFIAPVGTISPGTAGLYNCDRGTSSVVTYYHNGISFLSDTGQPSAVSDGAAILIGGRSDGFQTVTTLSEAHIGGSLGSTLNLAFYNRLRTYMTAVGVP